MNRLHPSVAPVCLGDLYLVFNGIEGWCSFPGQPRERATVELLVNGDVTRAARATRFLPSRRDLGMDDGYCGFWFPMPEGVDSEGARTVLEARERGSGQLIGRVILGDADRIREPQLETASAALEAVSAALDDLDPAFTFPTALDELGRTLLHLATRPDERGRLRVPGLAACLDRIASVHPVDLGWSSRPHLSIFVPPSDYDIARVAATLQTASRALHGLGKEFMLLDNGGLPLTALLPTRLRHLVLVHTGPAVTLGSAFNSAAALARGTYLAFARSGGPHPAGLELLARDTLPGVVGLDAALVDVASEEGATVQLHRVECIIGREDFAAIGGFDPVLQEAAMWQDFAAKVEALGLRIRTWNAPRPAREFGSWSAGDA